MIVIFYELDEFILFYFIFYFFLVNGKLMNYSNFQILLELLFPKEILLEREKRK